MKKYNEDFTTITSEVYDKIQKATEKLGCMPIMICRLTNHPEDSHLYCVVGQYIEPHPICGNAYCVWEASVFENYEASLFYGHYGMSFKTALRILNDKVRDLNKEEEAM
jgi:hypothetical protein